MKEFDLSKALAGAPVVTRDGRKVTELKQFNYVNSEYKLVGSIDGNLHSFRTNGTYWVGGTDPRDLFMAPLEKTVWTNLYVSAASSTHFFTKFSTEAQADFDDKGTLLTRIGNKAHKLTYTE